MKTIARFDGITYSEERDGNRLSSMLERVLLMMIDGQWRTLQEIREFCGGTDASISARLRDLRKPKFGAYDVERRYVSNGLWEYRVMRPDEPLPF